MCDLLLGGILLVLLALGVQSERLRRALNPRASVPAPPGPSVTPSPPDGPGLSAHCGHTHHTLVTDRHGMTACPTCAGRP